MFLLALLYPTLPHLFYAVALGNRGIDSNKFVNVKGSKSPYDGDMAYWSQRNSTLYDDHTSRALKRQNHTCGYCGLKCISDERVHLHHSDGNHGNWRNKNLIAVHESCHKYIHMGKRVNP